MAWRRRAVLIMALLASPIAHAEYVKMGPHDSLAQIRARGEFCFRFQDTPADLQYCHTLSGLQPQSLLHSSTAMGALPENQQKSLSRLEDLALESYSHQPFILPFERLEQIPFSALLEWREKAGSACQLLLFGDLHKDPGMAPVRVEIQKFADATEQDRARRAFYFGVDQEESELDSRTQQFLEDIVAPMLQAVLNNYYGLTGSVSTRP